MEYEYDIFVSYANHEIWTPWVREIFVRKLKAYLAIEVPGNIRVSMDCEIEIGAYWEPNLWRRLARSKIMIPILSANYFDRDWCRREMAMMLERGERLGLGVQGENYGLLLPVRIGDGDSFPDLINAVQFMDFGRFADPDLAAGTRRAMKFNDELRRLAKSVARTLPQAPRECREEWGGFNGDAYYERLRPKSPPDGPEPPRLQP